MPGADHRLGIQVEPQAAANRLVSLTRVTRHERLVPGGRMGC